MFEVAAHFYVYALYVFTNITMYIHIFYVHAYIYIYICIHIIYIYACMCMYVLVNIYIYIYRHIYTNIQTYIHTYIHIYIFNHIFCLVHECCFLAGVSCFSPGAGSLKPSSGDASHCGTGGREAHSSSGHPAPLGLRYRMVPPKRDVSDGKMYRKTLYLMVITMVSCRFSLKPIQ